MTSSHSLNTVTLFHTCKQDLMLLALHTTSTSTGLTAIVGCTSHNTALSQPSRTTSQTWALCTSVWNTQTKDADYCRCQKLFMCFTYENESGLWVSMQNKNNKRFTIELNNESYSKSPFCTEFVLHTFTLTKKEKTHQITDKSSHED